MAFTVEIEREAVGDVTILALKGEFDVWNLSETREAVDDLIGAGARKLVLNLHGLTFITSSAVGLMIKTYRELKELDGELVIAVPSNYFHRTLTTLGVDQLFKVFPTNEDAVEYFDDGG